MMNYVHELRTKFCIVWRQYPEDAIGSQDFYRERSWEAASAWFHQYRIEPRYCYEFHIVEYREF